MAGGQQCISRHTIENHFLPTRYTGHHPSRVSLLTAHNRTQCLAWARKYRHWVLEMWNMLSGLMNEIHVSTCRWQGTNIEETSWSDGSVLPADTFQAGGGGIFIWELLCRAEMKFVVLKINFVRYRSILPGYAWQPYAPICSSATTHWRFLD